MARWVQPSGAMVWATRVFAMAVVCTMACANGTDGFGGGTGTAKGDVETRATTDTAVGGADGGTPTGVPAASPPQAQPPATATPPGAGAGDGGAPPPPATPVNRCVDPSPALGAACVAACMHLIDCGVAGNTVTDCAASCSDVGQPFRDRPQCLDLLQQFHECTATLGCEVLRTTGIRSGACVAVADSVHATCPAPMAGYVPQCTP